MTDFITQAKEYFEQNPDKEIICLQGKTSPDNTKIISKHFIDECELIQKQMLNIENNFMWEFLLNNKQENKNEPK